MASPALLLRLLLLFVCIVLCASSSLAKNARSGGRRTVLQQQQEFSTGDCAPSAKASALLALIFDNYDPSSGDGPPRVSLNAFCDADEVCCLGSPLLADGEFLMSDKSPGQCVVEDVSPICQNDTFNLLGPACELRVPASLNVSAADVGGDPAWYMIQYCARVLDLNSKGLEGTLGPFADLPSLTALKVPDNAFEGTLEPLRASTKLIVLDAHNNALSGTIEPLKDYRYLSVLDLSGNRFTGDIRTLGAPTFFLPTMTRLTLADNGFSGSINALERASLMSYLKINGNSFNGTLDVINGMAHMSFLNVSYNNFTGSLPVARLDLLGAIDARSNALNTVGGTSPWGILKRFPNVQIVHLEDNELTDDINTVLNGINTYLYELGIANNSLTGTINQTLQDHNRRDKTGIFSINLNTLYMSPGNRDVRGTLFPDLQQYRRFFAQTFQDRQSNRLAQTIYYTRAHQSTPGNMSQSTYFKVQDMWISKFENCTGGTLSRMNVPDLTVHDHEQRIDVNTSSESADANLFYFCFNLPNGLWQVENGKFVKFQKAYAWWFPDTVNNRPSCYMPPVRAFGSELPSRVNIRMGFQGLKTTGMGEVPQSILLNTTNCKSGDEITMDLRVVGMYNGMDNFTLEQYSPIFADNVDDDKQVRAKRADAKWEGAPGHTLTSCSIRTL